MAKSSWRDRFEFALQSAVEKSAGVRELATRGLEVGAQQLGAWQERQRKAELLTELGRLVLGMARDGRLGALAHEPSLSHLIERLEGEGEGEAEGEREAERQAFAPASWRQPRAGGVADPRGVFVAAADEDDGTVSSRAYRAPAPWATHDVAEDADLASFMHPDDLDPR